MNLIKNFWKSLTKDLRKSDLERYLDSMHITDAADLEQKLTQWHQNLQHKNSIFGSRYY